MPGTGKLDVFTLSGGLSKHWRLPGVLQRLGRWGGRRRGGGGGGAEAGGGGGYGGGGGAAEGGSELAGSVSSFVDVKTGCLLEGSAAPRPFTQEVRSAACARTSEGVLFFSLCSTFFFSCICACAFIVLVLRVRVR